MDRLNISIAKDYSITPGPRLIIEGSNSAEKFNNDIFFPVINRAIEQKLQIDMDLDGTMGYATSFLDEVFGKAVEKFGYETITEKIKLISNEEPYLTDDIKGYMKDAKEGKKKK